MSSTFNRQFRTRIKVCGLTRAQDVDAAVNAGVDAIGFVLYEPSPRSVSIKKLTELVKQLPPLVTPILLFVNPSFEQVRRACNEIAHATIQFHGDETASQCTEMSDGRPFWKAARIPLGIAGAGFNLLKYVEDYSSAQAVLLDSLVEGYGGGGKAFNWSTLPPNVNANLVLSGGLNALNVAEGILEVRPRCKSLTVDVSSGVEFPDQKGIKDTREIFKFVAAVKSADQNISN